MSLRERRRMRPCFCRRSWAEAKAVASEGEGGGAGAGEEEEAVLLICRALTPSAELDRRKASLVH